MIRVFLDANVYFAGCLSKEGASRFVLELTRRGKMELAASRLVLREADRNLRKKASPQALRTFRRFLQDVKIRIVQPAEDILKLHEGTVDPKDLPVIAAAVSARADYFLTLDRKHFLDVGYFVRMKKPRVMNPGRFLKEVFL